MSSHNTDTTPLQASARPKYQTPPGHRVIHAVVPEATFVHVHKMALESGMRFSHYLARFLEEAFPYPASPLPLRSNPSQLSAGER